MGLAIVLPISWKVVSIKRDDMRKGLSKYEVCSELWLRSLSALLDGWARAPPSYLAIQDCRDGLYTEFRTCFNELHVQC